MKKFHIFILSAISLTVFSQDLAITGVIDGPSSGGGIPKAIELHVINNIPDLSIYGVGSANNGGGTDGEEFTFPAVSASSGDYIYIAFETTSFTDYLGFLPDYSSQVAGINGDDAIELFKEGNVVDVFGDINTDGSGEPWEYRDGWAIRLDGFGPNTTFTLSEWQFSGVDATDGCTNNATCSSVFPINPNPRISLIESINSLNYELDNGPSFEKNIDVVGTGLTNDIIVTMPINFEVSSTSGSAFSNSVTLPPSGSEIFVRLASGLTQGTYSGDMTATSVGVSDEILTLPGDVISSDFTGLIITAVFDGPLSGPAGIELFARQNIPDLSVYGLRAQRNGGLNTTELFTFPSVSISAGEYLYVASEASDFNSFFGFEPDYTTTVVLINGDDLMQLSGNGQTIDVYGEFNQDGSGEPWEYSDGWAYRMNNTGPNFANFNTSNWSFSGVNALDGETTNATAVTPVPIGTFVTTLSTNSSLYISNYGVYPNPTSLGFVNITSVDYNDIKVAVYDILGKLIKSDVLINNRFNVSDLNTGVYILKISQNNTIVTKKLVIK
ncbi:Endonuclease I [Flavobacteriales bacterium ALC-1]|nr:Endonuclease I [Flavobacteriales bacterium ALC-1]